MLCEFIDRLLSGDREAVKRVPELPLLIHIAKMIKENPQTAPMLTASLNPLLLAMLNAGPKEKQAVAAIFVAHVYVNLVPPGIIAPLIERAYMILDRLYEECRIEDLAVFLAEVAIPKALLAAHPKSYLSARALFKKAESILKSLADDSPGFHRSIGMLYLKRSDAEIKVGRFKSAIALALKALKHLKQANHDFRRASYDKLIRAHYLAGSDEYEKYIAAFVKHFIEHPVIVRFAALDYIITDDERLYELLPKHPAPRDPILAIALIKHSDLGREVAMKKLGFIARNRDPFLSLLARISLADLDVDMQRIINELKRSIAIAISAGMLDMARRAVRVGEKKGVPESELNERRKMIREAYKRGEEEGPRKD